MGSIRATGHLYPTIQEIATNLPAKWILEVGVNRGHSTLPLLEAAKANQGHVWSLDIVPCNRAVRNVRGRQLTDFWTFDQMCSWSGRAVPRNHSIWPSSMGTMPTPPRIGRRLNPA